MRARYPGLSVCGTLDGYGNKEDAARIIAQTKPDAVFVCLGMGTQETWMRDYGEETGASLLIGLGGSLDVYAGVAKRAPKLFLKLSLEWFWRLLCQPSRLGRMLKLPKFLKNVKKEAKKRKKQKYAHKKRRKCGAFIMRLILSQDEFYKV